MAGGLSLAAGAPAGAAPQAACQAYDISTGGGFVHYQECNEGWGTTVEGYVKDTSADGRCAWAYTKLNGGRDIVNEAKACPKSTETYFWWSYPGYAPVQVQVYLKVV